MSTLLERHLTSDRDFQQIVDDLTRRGFLGGGLAAAAAAGLGACSSDGGSARSLNSAGDRETTVDFHYRDVRVEVPADPQRVVVIEGRGDLEFAILAGYPVVATRSGGSAPDQLPGDQFDGLLGDDVTVLSSGDVRPNMEEIAALAPDLIIMRVNAWEADWYGNKPLSKIAPVLPVEVNRADFRTELDDQLTLLGRTQQMATWVTSYDDAVAEASERLRGFIGAGRKVAFLTTEGAAGGSILVWTNLTGTQVAHEVGLDVLFRDEKSRDGFFEISTERLDDIDEADTIFFQTTAPEATEAIPTWERLRAVQAGNAFVYPVAYNNGLVITGAAIARLLADRLDS